MTIHRDHTRTHHGDTVVDPFHWLSDKTDDDVIAWLTSQNSYADAMTADQQQLRDQLFEEYVDRIQETDMSVPVLMRGWWYFARTEQGKQYGISCRVSTEQYPERPQVEAEQKLDGEQVVIDKNVEAADGEFFQLGGSAVSVCGRFLAYSVDTSGDERYDLKIRDIATADIIDDEVSNIGYGLVWSAAGDYVWYTRVDDAWRPHQVWRHRVGSPAADDVMVFEDTDERFFVGIERSDDDAFLMVQAGSKTSDETHILPLDTPDGQLRCLAPREDDVEYSVSIAGDRLLITHNRDNPNFDIATAPLAATGPDQWQQWVPGSDTQRILGVAAFEKFAVVVNRSNALLGLHVAMADPNSAHGYTDPAEISFDEELYTATLGANSDYHCDTLLLSYQSMVTPRQVVEYRPATGDQTVLKQQEVLGDVDLSNYRQVRLWAPTKDGQKVPMSVMHHKDTPLDGTAPAWLYGYGSYEHSVDPTFSTTRLSLADRGVVFAICHIRGGGELGRAWYDTGKMMHKKNTFNDFVACADYLADEKLADPDRLAASGGSAGGLLIGAAINLAPERFRVVHAAVPFVDTLTTILDPTLPLTVTEWEEWGNPLHDKEAYKYIKSYSPCNNVSSVAYPAVLATTSLNDTRVFYTEPAKWVAQLQESSTSDPAHRPVLLWTEMVAGHGGRSGRYDSWRELARDTAFVLDQLGITAQR